MKILALIPESNAKSPARIYRGEGFLERLHGLPHDPTIPLDRRKPIEIDYWSEEMYRADWSRLMRIAKTYDWLFVMRSAEPRHMEICAKLKAFGLKMWYDLDDDYSAVEPDNVAQRAFRQPEIQNAWKWFMGNADLITYSTKQLLDKFGNGSL